MWDGGGWWAALVIATTRVHPVVPHGVRQALLATLCHTGCCALGADLWQRTLSTLHLLIYLSTNLAVGDLQSELLAALGSNAIQTLSDGHALCAKKRPA